MLRFRLRPRVVWPMVVVAPALALVAGCGNENPPEITFNAGPATLPSGTSLSSSVAPEMFPAPAAEPSPLVLGEEIDRGVDRAGAAVDATLERVDTTVSRASDRADQTLRKADAAVDQAVERVDATVSQAEQRADRAVGQAVDRARGATERAAEGVRRVGVALDSFSRSLEREPRAPR